MFSRGVCRLLTVTDAADGSWDTIHADEQIHAPWRVPLDQEISICAMVSCLFLGRGMVIHLLFRFLTDNVAMKSNKNPLASGGWTKNPQQMMSTN